MLSDRVTIHLNSLTHCMALNSQRLSPAAAARANAPLMAQWFAVLLHPNSDACLAPAGWLHSKIG